ncbi:MAG: 16S rRNA (cytidine(1402)-2'-O)-methyltransferase [Kiritimatiellae bacterium]|nr:16S rRNA (cytidine(1402)-2'-O)-methyltransferase [Kiritimatiellia bacterium]
MLYIAATPIGNLGDLTARVREVFSEAEVIACEDTRRTRTLLSHMDIPRPERIISYREGTEERTGKYVMNLLDEGKNVVLCTDGGYPGISDPGYRLICMAVDKGVEFQVIPGPSAVPIALLLSGLPSSSYTFKGYPPRKKGARMRFFEEEKDMPHTLVIFESPYRAGKTLFSAFEALGDRRAAVCIELTKKFERVSRGFLSELAEEFQDKKIKGEVSIVIAGNNPKFTRTD